MIKVAFPIYNTHFAFVVFENLQQITHDIGEKSYASKHNCQSSNHLYVAYRIVVSITYGWQNCKRKVYTCHELDIEQWVAFVFLPHFEVCEPSAVVKFVIIVFEAHLGNGYSEPEAS